jgi:hypothetical protein
VGDKKLAFAKQMTTTPCGKTLIVIVILLAVLLYCDLPPEARNQVADLIGVLSAAVWVISRVYKGGRPNCTPLRDGVLWPVVEPGPEPAFASLPDGVGGPRLNGGADVPPAAPEFVASLGLGADGAAATAARAIALGAGRLRSPLLAAAHRRATGRSHPSSRPVAARCRRPATHRGDFVQHPA